jgi:hypothetical protein
MEEGSGTSDSNVQVMWSVNNPTSALSVVVFESENSVIRNAPVEKVSLGETGPFSFVPSCPSCEGMSIPMVVGSFESLMNLIVVVLAVVTTKQSDKSVGAGTPFWSELGHPAKFGSEAANIPTDGKLADSAKSGPVSPASDVSVVVKEPMVRKSLWVPKGIVTPGKKSVIFPGSWPSVREPRRLIIPLVSVTDTVSDITSAKLGIEPNVRSRLTATDPQNPSLNIV